MHLKRFYYIIEQIITGGPTIFTSCGALAAAVFVSINVLRTIPRAVFRCIANNVPLMYVFCIQCRMIHAPIFVSVRCCKMTAFSQKSR